MHTQILIPIDGFDRCATLLNAYQRSLLPLEAATIIDQSMAGHAALTAQDEANNTQHLADLAQRQYHLLLLTHSFHKLYACLCHAQLELEEFASEGANLNDYAAQKRAEYVVEYGSDDGKDYHPDGSVGLRDDSKALAPFQLALTLAPFFAGNTTSQGECIGSSLPQDFAYFSNLVATDPVFTPPNLASYPTADKLTAYRRCDALELSIEESVLADERFSDLPEHSRGPKLVAEFNALLLRCQAVATRYHTLAPTDANGFVELFEQVDKLFHGEDSTPLWTQSKG